MDNHNEISPEERDVDGILNAAAEKIGDFEKQIENLPFDKGLAYTYGREFNDRPFGAKAQREFYLKSQIDAVKTEARNEAGRVIENSSRDTRLKVGEKIYMWQNPDAKNKSEQKDMAEAQERLLSSMRKKDADKTSIASNQKNEPNAPAKTGSKNPEMTSMSTRFSMTLRYNKIPEKKENSHTKIHRSPRIERDRD